MKVFISAQQQGLDAPTSDIFGRAPWYVSVDSETLQAESFENHAQKAQSGAGIEAAQWLINHGAQVVISANIGPKALQVLRAANIPVYLAQKGSVQENVELWLNGELQEMDRASTAAHSGM